MADRSGYVVGIDLGTTFTAAAIARDGRTEIVSLGHTAAVIPSVVLVREDGEVLVGEAAERRAASEPTRVGREFKRRLGDPVPLVLGGTPYGAEALTAHLLRAVYDRVVEQQGGPPDSVVVTHPANYGDYKLDLVREAIRLADVPDARLLTEPEAAATHYGEQDRLDPGDVVAVYDFGGGTFDAAVLRVGDDGFELLGEPEGMERLGGIDFDQAVYSHVTAVVGDTIDQLDPTDAATVSALARLREESREAKEALSSDTDVDVPVLLPNLHTDVRMTRGEFEAMIRPRIDETIDSLRRAIRSAGLEPDGITRTLLVGGSSRIPLVAEMVGAATGRPVAVDAHPKHAIAEGAALHAWRGLEPDAGAAAPVAAAAAGASAAAADATAAGDGAGEHATSDQATTGAPSGPPDAAEAAGDEDGGKRRGALLALAAVVVAALAAGGWFLFGGGDDDAETTDAGGAVTTAEAPATTSAASATTATPSTSAGAATTASAASAATTAPTSPAGTTAPSTTEAVIVTAGEVILEPIDDEGDAPFTASVAGDTSDELLAFAAAGGRDEAGGESGDDPDAEPATSAPDGPTALVSRSGGAPGLYGGTRNEASCDPDQLVEFLADEPVAAAAWAEVHELEEDEIAEFVDELTPIVLTSDTRVTNHDLVDGEAVPFQSVLQTGTAVMVDEFGVPRVRCSSGSPLLPPEAVEGTTRYTGPAWDTFSPSETVVVAPDPAPLEEFVLFDFVAGDEFVRPAGTTGAADRAVLPGEVLAEGTFTSFPDYDGPFDVNEIRMIFRPEGGPVEATFAYAITFQGVTISGDGDLTGEFDAAANAMSGTGFGSVEAGGFGGSGTGSWTATVDPSAGLVSGQAGDAGGTATFELTFEPYEPPSDL